MMLDSKDGELNDFKVFGSYNGPKMTTEVERKELKSPSLLVFKLFVPNKVFITPEWEQKPTQSSLKKTKWTQ